jgi:hypothetical protein
MARMQAPPRLRPYQRALRDGLVLAGLLFTAYLFLVVAPNARTFGFDAFAYWSVDSAYRYGAQVGRLSAFTYSPAIALLFDAFGALPWPTFLWLWTALQIATLLWLGGSRTLWLLAFPPVALELYHGNIHLLMAAAIVIGFRYPGVWAFMILAKVTPGIGLAWFAVRREWRSLAIALAVTAGVALVSFALLPGPWRDWIAYVAGAEGRPTGQASIDIPLLIRVPIALAIVIWGARTDRRWTVPVAVTLAMPVLWPTSFAICAACLPLAGYRRGWRRAGDGLARTAEVTTA